MYFLIYQPLRSPAYDARIHVRKKNVLAGHTGGIP